MNEVLDFAAPAGYRVVSPETEPVVECERGCGWKMHVATLVRLPADARDRLFCCHEDWHNAR